MYQEYPPCQLDTHHMKAGRAGHQLRVNPHRTDKIETVRLHQHLSVQGLRRFPDRKEYI